MMDNKCLICNTKCIGCAGGRCKCGMNKSMVTITNDLILKHGLQGNGLVLTNLIKLAKKKLSKEEIESNMYNTKEEINNLVGIQPVTAINGYCQFPAGSVSQGARVECIHCGKPRFETQGKPCESLNNK